MDDGLPTDEERAAAQEEFKASVAKMSNRDRLELKAQMQKDKIERGEKGQFLAGAPTPNPRGRGAGKEKEQRRRCGMSQTVKDLLELLEEPVPVRKGKVTTQVPAIVAIYQRMIHMAVQGDWNAIKKVVEMREKYSDFRENTLKGLMFEAQACRQSFKDHDEKLPDHVKGLLDYIDHRVLEGQFEAG